MSTTDYAVRPVPQIIAHEVQRPRETKKWVDWVTTTDHKKIGIMYMVTTFVFFILGGVEALLMRLQLGVPNNTLISAEHYNQLLTIHGTTMIFLFVVPIMAGFGNYFVPLMIGARDMAFPRLNALSFWLLLFGGIVFYFTLFFRPPEAGWWSYPPLSETLYSPSGGQDAWIFLIHITGISSLVGAINFYATIVNMRAPGMSWGRLPLFVWSILIYAVLLIVALPVVAAAVTMLLTDRHFGTHFFDPTNHGSPVLWQHLFWFFGHPEVYIMILPGFGMISEVIPVYSRKPIFGYKAIAAATAVIAFLAVLVWAHHMFASPVPVVVLGFFMLSSFLIGVPTGVKIFNWVATLWRGSLVMTASLYFAIGFMPARARDSEAGSHRASAGCRPRPQLSSKSSVGEADVQSDRPRFLAPPLRGFRRVPSWLGDRRRRAARLRPGGRSRRRSGGCAPTVARTRPRSRGCSRPPARSRAA